MERTPPPSWAVRTAADRQALADGYYWDQAQADRIIRFMSLVFTPKKSKTAFVPFEWQRRFLMSIYGWRRPDGGRRFQQVILHIPKKNGKTLIVSAICLYELMAMGTDALVFSGSTTKRNAKQVYFQLENSIRKNKKLKRKLKATEFNNTIKYSLNNSSYQALSSDAGNAEGEDVSAIVIDEAHAHRSDKFYRSVEHSMIGREDGFMLIISTAGNNLGHWYYERVVAARKILDGTDLDPTTYAEVYEADPEKDDLDDPEVWKRCNPSLGLYPGFTVERFALALKKAKKNTGDWLSFQRYRLNVYQRTEEGGWIDLIKWDACKGSVAEEELLKAPCWLGFDASQTTDPTSVSAVWLLPEKRFFVRSWAWVAEEGVRKREQTNEAKYAVFIAEGSMFQTKGNLIDKEAVRKHILDLAERYQVQGLVMDPNGAWVFGAELAGEGLDVTRMPQNYKHFNDPTKSFEEAVIAGKVTHDGAGWLRYCVNSVRLDQDSYGNVRPSKGKSVDHIDGGIATLMGFALANQASAQVKPKKSVYEDRGIVVM